MSKLKQKKSMKRKSKLASVSQNVIFDNILNGNYLEHQPEQHFELPNELRDIFNQIITESNYIGTVIREKNASYYNMGMGYTNLEPNLQNQRGNLVRFMTEKMEKSKRKKLQQQLEERKKHKSLRKKPLRKSQNFYPNEVKKSKNLLNKTGCKSIARTKPSVVKTEAVTAGGDNGQLQHNIIISESKSPCKILDKKKNEAEKEEEEEVEIIQVVQPDKKPKSTTKEHSIVDKLLLGINCIRTWTESGLKLSKLSEHDLILLNRRCSNINCTLSGLTEHKDENNHQAFLSVMLKCHLFNSYLNISPIDEIRSQSAVNPPVKFPIIKPPSIKQHIPAMYRQRHSLPSILTKSSHQVSHSTGNFPQTETGFYPKFSASQSHITLLNNQSDSIQPIKSEIQPTASQLLKLKSQSFQNIKTEPVNQQDHNIAVPIKVTLQGYNSPLIYRSCRPSTPNGITLKTTRLIPLNNQSASFITRVQRVSTISTPTTNYNTIMSSKFVQNPINSSSTNQSQILKHLLQSNEASHLQKQSPISLCNSTQGMMTISDFRNAKLHNSPNIINNNNPMYKNN